MPLMQHFLRVTCAACCLICSHKLCQLTTGLGAPYACSIHCGQPSVRGRGLHCDASGQPYRVHPGVCVFKCECITACSASAGRPAPNLAWQQLLAAVADASWELRSTPPLQAASSPANCVCSSLRPWLPCRRLPRPLPPPDAAPLPPAQPPRQYRRGLARSQPLGVIRKGHILRS